MIPGYSSVNELRHTFVVGFFLSKTVEFLTFLDDVLDLRSYFNQL